MNNLKKLSAIFTVLVLTASLVQAQMSIPSMSTPVTEDFTGFNGGGFSAVPSAGELDSDTWRVTGLTDGGMSFGGNKTSGDFARGASTGGVAAGGIYGFDIGGADVTLGVQQSSGDMNPGEITLKVENNTGQSISVLEVNYDIYVLNDQNNSSLIEFAHSNNDASYTNEASLDYTSPAGSDVSGWTLEQKSITLTGLSIPDGAFYYIQWQLVDLGTGARDEFGLDNISVEAILPEIEFVSSSYTNDEADGNMNLEFSISHAPSSTVTVDLGVVGGTAADPADYTVAATTVTFPAGSVANQTVSVNIVDDNLVEGDETVDFLISNPSTGAAIGTTDQSTLTITDNDNSELSFNLANQAVNEAVGSVNVEVVLTSGNATSDVTVDVVLIGGTATEGVDFNYPVTQTVTFPAGNNAAQMVTFPIIDDAVIEGPENILFELQNESNGTISTPSQHDVIIEDNDREVEFLLANDAIIESGGSINVEITINPMDPSNPTSVDVTLTGGTATNGTDYTWTDQTVTFPAGSGANQIINVPITSDVDVEGDEDFILTLSNATNGVNIGANSATTITITDDDVAPEVSFNAAGLIVDESIGTATLTLTITNPHPTNATTVDVVLNGGTATEGADFDYPATQTVIFPANDGSNQTLSFPITDDLIVEAGETAIFDLANASNGATFGTNRNTVTITDNDLPGISFTEAAVSVDEGAVTLTVSTEISEPADCSASFRLVLESASEPEDMLVLTDVPVTFSALLGLNNADITVNIMEDELVEGDETFLLILDAVDPYLTDLDVCRIGVQDSIRVTIIDNEPLTEVNWSSVSINVNESDGVTNLDAVAAEDATCKIVVKGYDVDANFGSDLVLLSDTLFFNNNSASAVSVNIIDDAIYEGVIERARIVMEEAYGACTIGSVAEMFVDITDNENVPEISWVSMDMDVLESAGGINLTLSISETSADCSPTVTVTGGSASAIVDYNFTDPQVVNFTIGGNSQEDVLLTIIDDVFQEGDETIVISIEDDPMDACIVNPASNLKVTILANDIPVYVIDDIDDEDSNGEADSLGINCVINATVQRELNLYSENAFWVNDGTGAITVLDVNDLMGNVNTGDSLWLEGTVIQSNGHTILRVVDMGFLGFEAVKPINNVLDLTETEESKFVMLTCLTLETETTITQPRVTFTDANNTEIHVQLDDYDVWDGVVLEAGAYDLSGFVLQNDITAPFVDAYEMVVQDPMDMVFVVSASFDAVVLGKDLSANYTGLNADSWNWDFGDGNNDIIEDVNHSYLVDGVYTVVLEATFGTCSHTVSKEQVINTSSVLTLEEESTNFYPVPVESKGSLKVESAFEMVAYQVFNAIGELVASNQHVHSKYLEITSFESSGMYVIQITYVNGVKINKTFTVN